MIAGTVLSGTGGVWRVQAADGQVVEAALRGRLKKHEDYKAREAKLTLEDLAAGGAVYLGNSVRGLIPAQPLIPRR